MRKIRWRKLIAMALSILMVMGTVTEWMPTVLAVGEASQTAETDSESGGTDTTASSGPPAKQLDFQDPDNGRPNLYVDFLGDNMTYLPLGQTDPAGGLSAPAAYDQSAKSNPTGTGNDWEGYQPGDVTAGGTNPIFWVGVGVDRAQVWKLLEGQEGLVSFEVGFYYNKNFIEPYTGDDYAATLTQYNIGGAPDPDQSMDKTLWSDAYHIIHAETDLPVQMDLVTQETLKEPSLEAIANNSYHDDGVVVEGEARPDWRMTYVSLELEADPAEVSLKRLANAYDPPTDDEGDPTVPDAASGDDGPAYLLYIPFQLKQYDSQQRLCLRLARNATHFSIGAGTDNTEYAAWERTTTRNPGKDLKLLTRFTGDLNIFTGTKADKDKEVSYSARLNFLNGGGAENTAVLSVLQDPGVTPVWADGTVRNGSIITGLQGGTGMEVKLSVQKGYTAKVWVVYTDGVDDADNPIEYPWTCDVVTDQEEYAFVMPEHNVIVYVQVEGSGITDYNLYLSEIPQPYGEGYQEGNETTITAGSVTINSFDPRVTHPDDGHGDGPRKTVPVNTKVEVNVSTHNDYQAVVRVWSFKTGAYLTSGIDYPDDATKDDSGAITLPFGGTVAFTMAQTDVDVVVEYEKGDAESVTLEVWHDGDPVKDINTAQFAYTIFDDASMPTMVYSGQVYEEVSYATGDDGSATEIHTHDAVKDPSEKTPWIPKSAATVSGSLGGDAGRTGKPWTVPYDGVQADMADGPGAVMSALLASTTKENNLYTKFSGLDLASAVLYEDSGGIAVTGLRKDLAGIPYGEDDLEDMAALLWELRVKAEKDDELKAAYWKTVPISAEDPTTAYTYLDLTPAQVQAYHLATLELDEVHQANVDAFRQMYTRYQEELALWEPTQDSAITEAATAPVAPIEPDQAVSSWDQDTGLRSYQDSAYVDTYIAAYQRYIERYDAYITSISPDVAVVSYDAFDGGMAPCPTAVPALAVVPLLDPDDAAAAVQAAAEKYGWEDASLPADPAPSNTIITRANRQVSILLQADSAYEVKQVQLVSASGSTLTGVSQPVQSSSYQNVYTFTVPSEDCVVRVHYAPRKTRTVRLVVQGADGEAENLAGVYAYQVSDPAAVTPTYAAVTNDGHQQEDPYNGEIEGVPVGGTVDLEVGVHEDYTVTVSVTNGPGGATVSCSGDEDAGLYSFLTPSGDSDNPVVVTVTYTPKSAAYHQAHIRVKQIGGSSSSENEAQWVANSFVDIQAIQGEELEGVIRLAPGYYIYASYAYGPSGGYPYTLDGNGYNNGLGSLESGGRDGNTLTVTMPNEELWVYIVVRKGLPSADPANVLSLIVKDDANTGAVPADNWVKATVFQKDDLTAQRVALDAVGKGATGQGVTEYHYDQGDTDLGTAILAGDKVVIDLNAVKDAGYYVSQVEVEPSYLGVAQQWQPSDIQSDGRQLSFTMPAGSATVTVTFSKTEESVGFPTYFVYVQKVELDADNDPVATPEADNWIKNVNSATIKGFAGAGGFIIPQNSANPVKVPDVSSGKGAGREGEEVTMTFQVAEGWYVQSVTTMTDAAAQDTPFTVVSGDNDGSGGEMTATLTMPAGDAWFIVNYRQCPTGADGSTQSRPEPPEYGVTLRILDEDNKSAPRVDNSVTASFGNSVVTHATPHAPITVRETENAPETVTATQYIHAGDEVTLTETLAEGYTLAYLLVEPMELGIYPTYVEEGKATFTMPAANITVVARVIKAEDHLYRANLILRPPEGMSMEDMDTVGQGTFTTGGGSLDEYPAKAIYSLLLAPGAKAEMDLFAFDGYYIDRVTIQPAYGASATLTGAFGSQKSGFVMPAADVNVNVWFQKGWPDAVKYDLTLKVFDPAFDPDNYAYFQSVGGTDLAAPDNDRVAGGQEKTLQSAALDGQEVVVAVSQGADYFYDTSSVSITDSAGNSLSWRPVAGGLAFVMPPRATAVEITFLNREDEPRPTRKAALVVEGNNGTAVVNLRRGTETPILSGGVLYGLYGNDVLTLTANLTSSDPKKQIIAAYAVDTYTGQQLLTPMGAALDGYNVTAAQFAVPSVTVADGTTDNGIYVYVKLADKTDGDSTDPAMRLLVSGPIGSGEATLAQADTPDNAVTVQAGSGDGIRCAQDETLLVTMEPADGYEIKRVTVTNGRGEDVSYEWLDLYQDPDFDPIRWNQDEGWLQSSERQISFPMPPDGGTVTVEYGKLPEEAISYTAQVVVNNDAAGGQATVNDAKLWNALAAGDQPDLQRLLTAQAGEWINLQITVQAGYRILPVAVLPQSYGIQPQLYLGDLDSQTTGFIMPAGDVTVYVTFVKDELQPFNATLVVIGPTGDIQTDGKGVNRASITSPRTGTKGPLDGDTLPASVQAVPTREWVEVDYTWDDVQYYPKSVTVRDQAGKDVPFTQASENHIELPMVSRNITITVTYADREDDPPPEPGILDPEGPIPDPEPLGCPVILHVIDASTGKDITATDQGYGKLTYIIDADTDPVTVLTTGEIPAEPIEADESDETWGKMAGLLIPAGKDVTLTAFSDESQGVYIQSAYVLYREGGQMISCDLTPNNEDAASTGTASPGFYGEREDTFQVHSGRNDVYVYLTREVPVENRYSATLMLKGDAGDMASAAAIFVGEDIQTADRKASVTVNGSHGKVDAARLETVKIVVTPQEGYDIDYVLVTPLGVPIAPFQVGHTMSFTMPGYNVSVCVYLKRSSAKEYTAAIHYEQRQAGTFEGQNKAAITYTPDGDTARTVTAAANKDTPEASIQVKEGGVVTLNVTLDTPYAVLAAYVLQDGRLVPLAPALEGTVETNSTIDNSLADGTATFTMPTGNVDVYVVTTDEPPTGEWYTAILTVQDPDDSGLNSASIRRDNSLDGTDSALPDPDKRDVDSAPPNQDFITARQGQVVTVQVKAAASGYIFDYPATLTHSEAYTETLRPKTSSSAYYVYEFTVGNCNSAVLANFKNAVAKENDLTVVIEDPDNPGKTGDDQVENKARVSVTDSDGKPELTVTSISPAGAYQVIPNVEELSVISITAVAHPGYQAYVHFANGDEDPPALALTPAGTDADGNTLYTAEATMPGMAAQVTVTFYKTYTATLVLEDRNTDDQATQAVMYADFPAQTSFPGSAEYTRTIGPVLVNQTMDPAHRSIPDLSRDTELRVQVTPEDVSRVVAVLRTDAAGTTLIQEYTTNEAGAFCYGSVMGRSDVTITVIVDRAEADPDDPDKKPGYVAAVTTVGLPSDAGTPAIDVDPHPDPYRSGQVWIVADEGGVLTVTAPAPEGYVLSQAQMKAEGGVDKTIAFTLDAAAGVYTWTSSADDEKMPAANVTITLTYAKEPTLTLRTRLPDELAAYPAATATTVAKDVSGVMTTILDADGQYAKVERASSLQVTADPGNTSVPIDPTDAAKGYYTPYVKEILMQTDDGVTTLWANDDDSGEKVTVPLTGDTLTMPDSDATITVVYRIQPTAGDPEPVTPYTAWVTVAGDDSQPENAVTGIANISDPGLYPSDPPKWACGVAETDTHASMMRLTFTAKAGYTAVVTAVGRTDGAFVPVIQQGFTGAGTAEFHMPAQDVLVTVRYYGPDDLTPEVSLEDVTLVLVSHDNQAGNKAQAIGGELGDALKTNGANGAKLVEGDPKSPAYVRQEDKVESGAELRLSADWAKGYKIARATLSVPVDSSVSSLDPDSGGYVASELPLNRYDTNATARFNMPTGENVIITVYYESVYTVTLNVQGTENGTYGDKIDTTDDRDATVTSTGADAIHVTGDRLLELLGGETVTTDAASGEDSPNRLVGVVYESDLTGARGTAIPTAPSYDFQMPEANVNLYAVFEEKPENEEDYSYIAKAALDQTGEPYGDGNTFSIKNTANSDARHGVFWTAAQAEDTVEITVNLKEGYQAIVTSAHMDDVSKRPAGADDFDFYVSRTRFVVSGKTTAFQMPAGTDTTVTVKFVKGYDFSLTMTDKTDVYAHAAGIALTETGNAEILASLRAEWTDDHSGVVAGTPDVSAAAVGTDRTTATATVTGLEGGLTANTALTLGADDASQIRVTWYTPFTGTQTVTKAGGIYTFETPAENVAESVLFKDANASDNLLAKVRLRGDSDINGNTAQPILDWTDQYDTGSDGTATPPKATTQGVVWTTTDGGHTIDLTFTVAKGYQAKIKVARDDSMTDDDGILKDESEWVFLDAKDAGFVVDPDETDRLTFDAEGVSEITVGFVDNSEDDPVLGGSIGKERHFRFVMPTRIPAQGTEGSSDYVAAVPETDVTVLVEFEYAGNIPAPYDPRNTAENDKLPGFLNKGYIYAESRGDYAVVEVPTLMKENVLYDTDNYGTANDTGEKPASDEVRFRFYILNHESGTYTELEQGKDIILTPYDPETLRTKDDPDTADVDEADPYNYIEGMYADPDDGDAATAERKYIGSKFLIQLASQSGVPSSQYRTFQSILDSDGSVKNISKEGETANYQTSLYILAEDAAKNQSSYTQVWVRPCVTLAGRVISYGPRHPLYASLYQMNEPEADVKNDADAFQAYAGTTDNYNMEEAAFTGQVEPVVWGTDKWQQVIRVRSSELLGGYTNDYDPDPDQFLTNYSDPTYALALKKAAHLTYTRVDLHLNAAESNAVYDPDSHTYSIQDIITLVAGDVDGDGAVKWQDQDMMMNYLFRSAVWSRRLEAPTLEGCGNDETVYNAALAEWDVSVNNPDSIPYHCDLDGDGTLAVADWNILLNRGNYNHEISDYNWEETAGDGSAETVFVLPHGMGTPPSYEDGPVLLSLDNVYLWTDCPVARDPVWDVPLTEEELALLGDRIYDPDVFDAVTASEPASTAAPEQPAEDLTSEELPQDDALQPEIPAGEEVLQMEDALTPEEMT